MNGPPLSRRDASSNDPFQAGHPHAAHPTHAELAGKIETNRKLGDLRAQMVQVEAVIEILAPDFNFSRIAPKRPNAGNPHAGRFIGAPWMCSGALRER
jgi:hypothetical protein